jgi:hypothetical protein
MSSGLSSNMGLISHGRGNPATGAARIRGKETPMRRALAALILTTACTGLPGADDPVLSDRDFELQEFFDGRLTAHGQFQDLFGTVRRRFEVTIDGQWDGETLRLVEDFVYEDGATEQRIWTLTQTGPETWQGTAPGVQGAATGVERGDTFNWRYTIDLPIPSADGTVETLRVTFDDWMWQMTDDRLFNRAYMQRAGVTIGEVSIWFER